MDAVLVVALAESGRAIPALVESALAVVEAVSVVGWLLLQAASKPRAATGAAALLKK
jgi:hypothetical protein